MGGSFMGMGGLAPDKLRPSLPPRYPPPFLLHSFSFLAKLTRCSYAAAVHCNVHYGPTITQPFHRYDTFENRRFERLLKPVKAAIVYLQCMFRDSHCYFSSMRLKSGGYGTPTPKSGGYAYPPYPPESYAYASLEILLDVWPQPAYHAAPLHWDNSQVTELSFQFLCKVNNNKSKQVSK